MSTTRTILKGSFWTYSSAAFTVLLGMASTVILSRSLDKEGWGLFSSALSVCYLFSVFMDLGFKYTLSYYTSKFSTLKQYTKLKAYIFRLFNYRFVLILAVALLMYLFSSQIADFFKVPGQEGIFQVSALFFIVANLISSFDAILSGLKRFKIMAAYAVFIYAARLAFAFLFVYLGFGAVGAMAGYAVAMFFAILLAIYFIRDLLFRETPEYEFGPKETTFDLLMFGGMVGIANLAASVTAWTGSIMVGFFAGATMVGVYKIAISVSIAASGLISAINRVIFPILVSIEAKKEETESEMQKVLKYGMFFSIPAFFGMAVLSSEIINLFFGQQYMDAAPVLVFLSYLCFDGFIVGAYVSYLSAKNRISMIGKSAVVSAVANIILNFALIPLMGLIGAAISYVATRILQLAMLFVESRKAGLNSTFELIKRPLIGSILMVVVILAIKQYISAPLLPLLVLEVALGFVVYVVSEALMGFNILSFGMKSLKLILERE